MISRVTVIAKANAHYICQECGSTEYIQAHHQIPRDDNSIIVLCAICHSKKHPDISNGLFISRTSQPYWVNKSASTLARELGVHPRTIWRVVRKLNISKGELVEADEILIKQSLRQYRVYVPYKNEDYGGSISMVDCPECGNKMHKSGHPWSGHRQIQRYTCSKCGRTTMKRSSK